MDTGENNPYFAGSCRDLDNNQNFRQTSGYNNLVAATQEMLCNNLIIVIMAKILVLHGPNLNLLGKREPEIYSSTSLEEINEQLISQARLAGYELQCLQTNAEEKLIDAIHSSAGIDFIIINPAAFTHTSIALRDALLAIDIPFIEVHLSNIYQRESFRQHSFLADIASGTICGFGALSYKLALQAAIQHMES